MGKAEHSHVVAGHPNINIQIPSSSNSEACFTGRGAEGYGEAAVENVLVKMGTCGRSCGRMRINGCMCIGRRRRSRWVARSFTSENSLPTSPLQLSIFYFYDDDAPS
ncbi:uncharacterized protein IAS62_006678 [Cryptococcus decagattii]|uniref:Uncharacterized protein n=1 Tax=Cryptococcus decagattii TaxID=1859122 RepID=A0ABZ2B3T0_9TREE